MYICTVPALVNFDRVEEMRAWAKKNCASYSLFDSNLDADVWYYRFYFGDETDFFWFALTWS
jgi:hypothetical protein